ncbi:MAG TPA: hypothetical protein PKX71_07170 [Candidatus Avimonas sp.]|jgi:hypothetical protein|nr:hypothetical protein [Clostridiales bacterium]HOB37327.1 hypothetical protein [Candidatus Avimonas sp.]HQA16717.1 hypothetical protein [Candidatus Avimonas sp.]HQD38789.1 hypothetical protein [Candidatus Avimonas sp.]
MDFIIKYVLLIPAFLLLTPITPLALLIPPMLDEKAAAILLPVILYALVFLSHRLGKIKFKHSVNI